MWDLVQTPNFEKNPNKCQWIILGAQPMGVACIVLLWLWLAKAAPGTCVSNVSSWGWCLPSSTNPPKSHQLQLVGSMPYSSWKMHCPVEIARCPKGLLRKSTFANTRAKSDMLLLPHNKILLPLLLSSWFSHPPFCAGLWKEILGMQFFNAYTLAVKYTNHFFLFFFKLHCVITGDILVSRCRNEN